MPTDSATASVDVEAAPQEALAVVRDVAAYPEWVKGFSAAEVLASDEDGQPTRVRFTIEFGIGADTYEVDLSPRDDGLAWQLVEPTSLQKDQRASFVVAEQGSGSRVTLELTVEHTLSVPGFLRKKVFGSFVKDAVNGIRTRVT